MVQDWFRPIELAIPFEQWELLPRFAGFKSEYFGGRAVWSPRPKTYNAVLDLDSVDAATMFAESAVARSDGVTTRDLADADWDAALPNLFAAAFHRMPPFCTLPDDKRTEAALDCLNHTRNGGDGEFLPAASVVATNADSEPIGAMLITRWVRERGADPAPDASATDAHITWVFVHPFDCGHGVGTLMLHDAVARLRRQGFHRLFTTFLAGNESSMLWHWRNGFRLLPYLGSMRRIRRRSLP